MSIESRAFIEGIRYHKPYYNSIENNDVDGPIDKSPASRGNIRAERFIQQGILYMAVGTISVIADSLWPVIIMSAINVLVTIGAKTHRGVQNMQEVRRKLS